MNIEESSWDWVRDHESLCISFTQGVSPKGLIAKYGADPETAVMAAWGEVFETLDPKPDSSILRVGVMGSWSFCLESLGTLGTRQEILSSLSQNTETIMVCLGTGGYDTASYWSNGQLCEAFEPGQPSTLLIEQKCGFWEATESRRLQTRAPSAAISALEVASDITTGQITADTATGALLSIALAWQKSASPLGSSITSSSLAKNVQLGPHLGELRLSGSSDESPN
ncbi:DUF6461 domain-containing protein [Streptomyces sp. NPDC086787]|uniref:DUF6461 domain-containing protein n=1 Tax=Streptomyces sp. NPDC086787 TaxID=3365759 RepID=UPI0038216EE8